MPLPGIPNADSVTDQVPGSSPAAPGTGGGAWGNARSAIEGAYPTASQPTSGSYNNNAVTSRPHQQPGGGVLGRDSRAETQQSAFQQAYQAPGTGEQQAYDYAAAQAGQLGAGNTQNQYFNQFQQQIGQDPGLGAYYDRAQDRAATGINAQLASRGAYGSSRGLGILGDTIGGLEAQRAKEEADYMLQQQELGGQFAQQAGQSQLDWTQGLGALGIMGDQAGNARRAGGMNAATAADIGFTNRTGMAYDQLAGITDLGTGLYGDSYQNQISGDLAMLDAGLTGNLGATGAGIDEAQTSRTGQAEWRGKAGQVIGAVVGGIGGAGGAATSAAADAEEQGQK